MLKQLELESALSMSQGLYGQLWEYHCTLARLLYRVYKPEEPVESSIYFLCVGCIRVEADIHTENIQLEITTIHDHHQRTYMLTDNHKTAIHCRRIRAFMNKEQWIGLKDLPPV